MHEVDHVMHLGGYFPGMSKCVKHFLPIQFKIESCIWLLYKDQINDWYKILKR